MSKHMARPSGVGFCVVASVVLAACGGASGPSSAGGTITIGGLFSLTGVIASAGPPELEGAQMAVDVINAGGGVLGRHLELQIGDDASDPVDAVPAAQAEVGAGVAAIVGPSSLTASAVLPVVDRANIPLFMLGGGSVFDHQTDPHFYRMTSSDSEMGQAMIYFAKTKGWTRVAIMLANDAGSQALVSPLLAAANKAGITVLANSTITPDLTSYNAEISQLFSNQPQAIIGQFDEATSATIFSELTARGLQSTPWIGTDIFSGVGWFKAVGASVATGPIYAIQSSTAGGAGYPTFLQALQKYAHKSTPKGFGETQMYDAVMVWALGVDQAGSLDFAKATTGIKSACCPPGMQVSSYAAAYSLIKKGETINYEGASSSVDFNQYHNVFGSFDVDQYTSSGSQSTLLTLSASDIAKLAG